MRTGQLKSKVLNFHEFLRPLFRPELGTRPVGVSTVGHAKSRHSARQVAQIVSQSKPEVDFFLDCEIRLGFTVDIR